MAVVECTKPRSREFEEQLVEHMDLLYSLALRLTRNPVDAQDLLHDAIARALKFHDKFREGTYFRAWMLTIVRNTFINQYRKRARRPHMVALDADVALTPSKPDPDMGYFPLALKKDHILEYLDEDIRFAVEALPEGHRRTVIMADLHSMSYKEIADEMNCPLGTVMSRLHRGRRLLRDSLKSYRAQVQYTPAEC